MSEAKRLHPITAILNALKVFKEFIIPFLVIAVFSSRGSGFTFLPLIGVAVVLVITLIFGLVKWYRFTYRIEEGELRIEFGIFVRNKRYIPFERIQSLDLSEGIFHRPFSLVKMKVETAGSSGLEAEAVLTAVTKDEADRIQEELQLFKNKSSSSLEEEAPEEKKEEILYKISMKELLLLASTSGGVGVVISAVVAFFLQFDELIPYETVFHELEEFIASGFIFVSVIVFIGFLLAWIIAVIGMMLKYADFTLKKVEDDIIISRGLLEKKQITIPLNRIQGIRISENILRQPLGYASVYIISAGGSIKDTEGASVNVLPFIKKNQIKGIIEGSIDGYDLSEEVVPAPKRSLRRYMFRGFLIVLPVIIILIYMFKLWGLFSLLLIPVSAVWSYLKYRDAGWRREGNQLTLSYRGLIKHTIFMRKNKIQSLSMGINHFQNKQDLATIEARVMSGVGGAQGKVVDLEKSDVSTIYRWYSREG